MSPEPPTSANDPKPLAAPPPGPPELYQILIECRDEEQQRELFELLEGEGLKIRLLVL